MTYYFYIIPFSIELLGGETDKVLLEARYSLGKNLDSADVYLGVVLGPLVIKAGYSPFIKTKTTIGDTPKGTELTSWFASVGFKILIRSK